MATFLAGRKLSRIGMDSDMSSMSTVDDRTWFSVRSTSKSSGVSCTGVPPPVRVMALRIVLPIWRLNGSPHSYGFVVYSRSWPWPDSCSSWRPTVFLASLANRSDNAWLAIRRMARGVSSSLPSLFSTRPESSSIFDSWLSCSSEFAASLPMSSRARSISTSARAPGLVVPRSRFSSWSRSLRSPIMSMAEPMSSGSNPEKSYDCCQPASGNICCRF